LEKVKRTPAGANMWSHINMGAFNGCEYGCRYCYASCRKLQLKQINSKNKYIPTPRKMSSILSELAPGKIKLIGKPATIMFPNTHDITENTIDYSIEVIKKIMERKAVAKILLVTKPNLGCTRKVIDRLRDYQKNIEIRVTIGSKDQSILDFWEPGAPEYEERIACLTYMTGAGFHTSVSTIPMLDNNIEAVVRDVRNITSRDIWIGVIRHPEVRIKRNTDNDATYMDRMNELLTEKDEDRIKELYAKYGKDKKIRWASDLRPLLGLEPLKERGLDI